MRVLKVEARGLTTSFRRPHFRYGIQPTFRMPPPATIYGHLCSTVGELVPPESVAFAYHFTAEAHFSDVEHIHLVAAAAGKLEGTALPKVLEGKVNPFKREMLFRPRLTFYLTRPDWEPAFRRPRYAVVLGRSQDLFSYTSIQVVELEQARHAYFEHTLLPYHMAVQVGAGIVELMPRYIDYERKRADTYGQYLLLEQRVHSEDFWTFGAEPSLYWVDPTSERDSDRGTLFGLSFHTFVGGEYAPGTVA
jgi:CRISPR-associated protein Cas5t